jgi:hypothetical protein
LSFLTDPSDQDTHRAIGLAPNPDQFLEISPKTPAHNIHPKSKIITTLSLFFLSCYLNQILRSTPSHSLNLSLSLSLSVYDFLALAKAMFEQSVDSILSIWASMNSWCTSAVLFVLLNLMIGTIAITSSQGRNRQQEAQEHPQQPQLARSPSMLQRFKSINFYSNRSQETTTVFEQTPESNTHYAYNQTLEQEQPQLSRSPSLLQRLESINLYSHRFQEPNPSISLESDTHYSTFQQPRESEEEEEEEEEEEKEEEEEEELAQASDQDQDQDQEADQYEEQTLDEIYGKLRAAHVSRTRSDTKPASGEMPVKLPRKMKKSASAKSAFAHFEEEDIVETRRPATVREGKVGVIEGDDEVDAKADDFINRFKQQLKLQRLDSIIRFKDASNRGSGK